MKRLFACIAACALFASLALAGCGSNAPASSSAASAQGSSAAATASQQADQPGELIETKATITDADGNTTSYTVQIPAADATALAVLEATDAEVATEDSQYGTYSLRISAMRLRVFRNILGIRRLPLK